MKNNSENNEFQLAANHGIYDLPYEYDDDGIPDEARESGLLDWIENEGFEANDNRGRLFMTKEKSIELFGDSDILYEGMSMMRVINGKMVWLEIFNWDNIEEELFKRIEDFWDEFCRNVVVHGNSEGLDLTDCRYFVTQADFVISKNGINKFLTTEEITEFLTFIEKNCPLADGFWFHFQGERPEDWKAYYPENGKWL